MRLRLTIQRPSLATAKLLWNTDFPIETSGQEHRISDLLLRINDVIPLECDETELLLNYYAVLVGGYECLHFQPVGLVFKEDDEVLIRHRTANELKLVTRSGRMQTTPTEGLLVDGVRFGSPFREGRVDRPSVLIPYNPRAQARKKRRIGDGDCSQYVGALADLEEDGPSDNGKTNSARCGSDETSVANLTRQTFEGLLSRKALPENNLPSDKDDLAFNPDAAMASDDSSEFTTDESESEDSSDDSEDEEVHEVEPKNLNAMTPQKQLEYPSSNEEMDEAPEELSSRPDGSLKVPKPSVSTSHSPESRRSNEKQTNNPPSRGCSEDGNDRVKERRGTAPGTVPHQASNATKARNQRKKLARQLQLLKDEGIFGDDIGAAYFKKFLEQYGLDLTTPGHVIKQCAHKHVQTCLQDGRNPGHAGTVTRNPEFQPSKTIKRAYKKARARGTVPGDWDIQRWLEEKKSASAEKPPLIMQESTRTLSVLGESQKNTQPDPESCNGQLKAPGHIRKVADCIHSEIDTGCTDENQDILVAPLDDFCQYPKPPNKRGRNYSKQRPVKTQLDINGKAVMADDEISPELKESELEQQPVHSKPVDWRQKISLEAVECEQSGVQLPKPDFPFHQDQLIGTEWMSKTKKRNRRKRKRQENIEQDQYEQNQDEQNQDEQDQYEGAYDEQQYDASMYDDPITAPTQVEAKDDTEFPALPADVETYPALVMPIQLGTVFAFKRLEMDSSYQPTVTEFKRAKIVEIDSDTNPNDPWLICTIPRSETKPKEYDPETGERILGRFDMPGVDDDAPDDALEINFSELITPKVLLAPPAPPEPEKAADEEQVEEDKEPDDEGDSGMRARDGEPDGDGSSGPAQDGSAAQNGDASHGQSDETSRRRTSNGGVALEQLKDAAIPEGQLERGVQSVTKAPVPDPFRVSMDDFSQPEPVAELEPELEQITEPTFEPEYEPEPESSPIVTPAVSPAPYTLSTPQAARYPLRQIFPNTPGYPKLPTLPATPSTQLLPLPDTRARSSSPAPPVHSSAPPSTQTKPWNIDEYDTDSDGLPSLSTILSSQPVKAESRASPASLPAIPKFSPLVMTQRQTTAPPSIEKARPSSSEKKRGRKLTTTAKTARRVWKGRGSVKGTGGGVVKVIDLTDSP